MPQPSRSLPSTTIPADVRGVLVNGRVEGNQFFLPSQLDRRLYESTNKVLGALGGRWNRKAGAHVFDTQCEDLIESAIDTGSYQRPADLGWFPTPPALAARVVAVAGITAGMRVLEPSGGDGALVREILKRGATVIAVEIDPGRAAMLRALLGQDNVIEDDFLRIEPTFTVDAVVANPPFAKRADVHHMNHAFKFLRPGGRLTAIMAAGITFREDKLTTEFRARLASIELLPEGAFKISGTSVNTVLVTG